MELLSGIRPITSGSFELLGERFSAERPLDPSTLRAMQAAQVPEDRLRMGLVRTFAAEESAILGYHKDPLYHAGLFMKGEAMRRDWVEKMRSLARSQEGRVRKECGSRCRCRWSGYY